MEDKSVTVIGLGHVGLPLVLAGIKSGYKVIGIDNDATRVSDIQNKVCPFWDPIVKKGLKELGPHVTTTYSVIKKANIIVVCVPTHSGDSRTPNLAPLKAACSELAHYLRNGQLVILESSVSPGVCSDILIPLMEKRSAKRCGKDFFVAYCPARVSPVGSKWHVGNTSRVVGGYDATSLKRAYNFYSHIVDAPVKKMNSLEEAEAVNMLENAFTEVNVALVNEFAASLSGLGIDMLNVIDGAATKPFSFTAHYPDTGAGALYSGATSGEETAKVLTHELPTLAGKINANMPKFIVSLLERELDKENLPIDDIQVTVLGLSHEPETDDLRASPAIKIIGLLQSLGADVTAYDPYVLSRPKVVKCKLSTSLKESVADAHAIVVVTAHQQFKDMDPAMFYRKRLRVVVDGGNCLDKKRYESLGFTYAGVGR